VSGVTTCAINGDGTLSSCAESPGTGTAGIAVSASHAYIGTATNAVTVCAIGSSGSLNGCADTANVSGRASHLVFIFKTYFRG
jgi:hypothetical protein